MRKIDRKKGIFTSIIFVLLIGTFFVGNYISSNETNFDTRSSASGNTTYTPIVRTKHKFEILNQELFVDGRRFFAKQAYPLFGWTTPFQCDQLLEKLAAKEYNIVGFTVLWDMFDANGDGIVDNSTSLTFLNSCISAAQNRNLLVSLGFNIYGVGGHGSNPGFMTAHPEAQAYNSSGQPAYDTEYSCTSGDKTQAKCKIPSIFSSVFKDNSRKFIKDLISKVNNDNVVWYETTVEPQYIGNQNLDYSESALKAYGTYPNKPNINDAAWNNFKGKSLGEWVSGDALAIKQIVPDALIAVDYLEVNKMENRMGNSAEFLKALTNVNIVQVNWHYGYCTGKDDPCETAYDNSKIIAQQRNWGISEHMTVSGDLVDMDISSLLNHTLAKGNKIGWNFITTTSCTSNGFCIYNDDWSPKGNLGVIEGSFKSTWQPKAMGIIGIDGDNAAIVSVSGFKSQYKIGEYIEGQVVIKNIGTQTWNGSLYSDNVTGRYCLGSDNNSNGWGASRSCLANSEKIQPQQQKSFNVKILVPNTIGNYTVNLKMVKELKGWFGPESVINFSVVNSTCMPSCTGKSCGDSNGCGSKCVVQTCGTGKTCNASATCVSSTPTTNSADVNLDGVVNSVDYNLFVTDYLKYRNTTVNTVRSDLNNDSKVNGVDYNLFVTEYLKARQ